MTAPKTVALSGTKQTALSAPTTPTMSAPRVRVELLCVGSCAVPAAALAPISAAGRRPALREWFSVAHCPALVLLVHHAVHGPVLVDTGYAPRFHDATRRWPERGYALTTPVRLPVSQQLLVQLAERQISAADIRHVVLTHLHADHVAGVRDFPHAQIHTTTAAVAPLLALGDTVRGRIRGTRAGFLRALLPDDFSDRLRPLEPRAIETAAVPPVLQPLVGHAAHERAPRRAYDVFGDGTVIAVDVPGHAPGMVGVLLPTIPRPLFLVADAVWQLATLTPGARFGLAERRIAWDVHMATETLRRLQTVVSAQPQVTPADAFALLSSHDASAITAYAASAGDALGAAP